MFETLLVILLLLATFSPQSAAADSGWVFVMPIPEGARVHGLYVPIEETAYGEVSGAINKLERPEDRAVVLGREFLNANRPVTEWEQVRAYDTAQECERQRELSKRTAWSEITSSDSLNPYDNDALRRTSAEGLLFQQAGWLSRCVPASAIYTSSER